MGPRLDLVRQLLTPPGASTIDNGTLLNTMCDIHVSLRKRLDGFHRLRSMCLMMHAHIASLAHLPYLEIIHRYLSRLYVVAISYEHTVTVLRYQKHANINRYTCFSQKRPVYRRLWACLKRPRRGMYMGRYVAKLQV